ncbi:hypothetical protein [Thiolapillus sp.]
MSSSSPRLFLLVALLLMLNACTSFGPGAIRHSRTDYNVVLQKTSDEQMLLNLVRLRYRDRPLFLEISALTTQFKFSPQISASISDGSGLAASGSLYGEIGFEEKPSVTYTPLQGKAFVQRVMSPISWRTLELLDNVGWRSDRVLRLCVQSMNGLGNAITASGPTPDRAPPYAGFRRAATLYNHLKQHNLVRSFRAKEKHQERVVQMLEFRPEALATEEYRELMKLLKLKTGQPRVEVLLNNTVSLPNALQVETRSFAGVLYFLSQSVMVPQQDIDAGRVTVTHDDQGRVFDWNRVTGGLMKILSSKEEPDNAAVKIHYRGNWFYIDDSDLDSKSTFSLLGQLFSLQSGDIKSSGPVLTLPVGG